MLVRDVSIIDAANLVGCGVGVEDVGVDDVDGDCDDNEVDMEDGEVDAKNGDESLADNEFEGVVIWSMKGMMLGARMGMVLWETWIMNGMTLTMMEQPMKSYMKLLWMRLMATLFNPLSPITVGPHKSP